jgi:hypothetical protein
MRLILQILYWFYENAIHSRGFIFDLPIYQLWLPYAGTVQYSVAENEILYS